MIPHSHCDAGWLVTDEEYFERNVEEIITSVVEALSSDDSLRFGWAETIWLEMWWNIHGKGKFGEKMKRLVNEKKIEFIGGGYVMNDEVIASYDDVIDQVTTGHQFIMNTFGKDARIKSGWQIDMFSGYSAVTPSLWAMMGYDSMVIRFEGWEYLRKKFQAEKAFEWVWRGSRSLKNTQQDIFTHCIYHNYGDLMGRGYNFDWDPDRNNPPVNSSNLKDMADTLVAFLSDRSQDYRGPTVDGGPMMVVWGSDFRFQNAFHQFGNMSLILDYVNEHSSQYGFRVRYSTLSEYFDHLYSLTEKDNLSFPLVEWLDFEIGWPHHIPIYNSTQYQTGALVSRAKFKQLIRLTNGKHLRPAENAYAISKRVSIQSFDQSGDLLQRILSARRDRALTQHHDSLAGTMAAFGPSGTHGTPKSWPDNHPVLLDYTSHLNRAILNSDYVFASSISSLLEINNGPKANLVSTLSTYTNLIGPLQPIAIVVFNPLGWKRTEVVKIPLPIRDVIVVDEDGINVVAQIQPASDHSLGGTLYFLVDIGPLAFRTFFITLPPFSEKPRPTPQSSKTIFGEPFSFNNGVLKVKFSENGNLLSVENMKSSSPISVTLNQQLLQYHNGTGGAYILVEPNEAIPITEIPKVTVTQGTLFSEVVQTFSKEIQLQHVVRLYNLAPLSSFLEVFLRVGPLEMKREFISRFTTDIDAQSKWWTDDSGFEMHEREFLSPLPDGGDIIGGNYHSLVGTTYLREISSSHSFRQFTVISSHSMGCTSLKNGELELMMHRRTNHSDDQGPWPLNDTTIIDIPIRLIVADSLSTESIRHRLKLEMAFPLTLSAGLPPRVVFSNSSSAIHKWKSQFTTSAQYMDNPLPENIHLLSFMVQDDVGHDQYVFRLQHLFEKDAHPVFSDNVTLDLSTMFSRHFNFSEFREKTLSLWVDTNGFHRRQWPYSEGTQRKQLDSDHFEKKSQYVTLHPVEIKSFIAS